MGKEICQNKRLLLKNAAHMWRCCVLSYSCKCMCLAETLVKNYYLSYEDNSNAASYVPH